MVKRDGQYILGGDIILSEAQVNYLQNLKPNKHGGKGTKSTFVTAFGKLWPNGIVYYTVRNDVYNTQIITDGIDHYESNTTLTFVPRTNDTNYVEFILITGNVAYAEYGIVGGKQEIKLPAASGTSTVIHEIGHTIGLMHEISRSDRDTYVNIYPANMVANALPNFQKYTDLGITGAELGPYDFGSVMGYESPFLGINSIYTSTAKSGSYMFYNYVLSVGDIDGINYLYDPKVIIKVIPIYNNDVSFDNSSVTTDNYKNVYDVYIEFYTNASATTQLVLTTPLELVGLSNGVVIHLVIPVGQNTPYYLGQSTDEYYADYGVVRYHYITTIGVGNGVGL